ncbi:hypothetical protein ABZ470_27465 [Streptosporangium sp. NPDC020072]|uniref:hypothetical protein n=1 Tax=Streptosporangium sp. NPDC020072 TaxID=3154788 RepID=UPI00341E3852
MRRAVQRAGLSLVLCLAALAAALLAHLILSAAHTRVAHHHHGPGPGQSGISVTVAGSPRERVPERCPAPDPPEHDHSLCGAATVAPATEARPLSSGPFTGLPALSWLALTVIGLACATAVAALDRTAGLPQPAQAVTA